MDVDVIFNENPESLKQSLRNNMLDYLCKSNEAHFKSQQIGEPELLDGEKRIIAESVLNKNYGTFLARFGPYLLEEHLEYFVGIDCSDDIRYEINFYLSRLRASHNKAISRVKVKNRRFEALKKLVNEGSYFSEYEMKKRNPLLYEHLIGQFLTEEEENERTGIDTSNITFVNLLLEQYDRDQMNKLKQRQEEAEDNQLEDEEEDSSNGEKMIVDNSIEENDSDCDNPNGNLTETRNIGNKEWNDPGADDKQIKKSLWGEEMTDGNQQGSFPSTSLEVRYTKHSNKDFKKRKPDVSDTIEYDDDEEENDSIENGMTEVEKHLLIEEFRSSMFNSFLEGKDADFDYHEVDDNSDYDDIDMREEDEQEKYFNSESPDDEKPSSEFRNGSLDIINGDAVPVVSQNNPSSSNGHCENIDDSSYIETTGADKITDQMKNLHH